jgi:dihydroxyacetone kinase
MKKLINRPDRYVDEALGGLCATFPGVYRRYRERNRIIARAQDKMASRCRATASAQRHWKSC